MNQLGYFLLHPHFTQTLVLSAAAMVLPLARREGWRRWLAPGLGLGFLLGGLLEYAAFRIESPWFLVAYFFCPLILAYALLRLVTASSRAECVYLLNLAYLCQHTGFCLSGILLGYSGESQAIVSAGKWAVYLGVLLAAYHGVLRKLPEQGHIKVTVAGVCATSSMVLLVALGLNYMYKAYGPETDVAFNIGLAYDLCCCGFLLFIQLVQRREATLWARMEAERRLRIQSREQYERSRLNVESINQKCHDLKHQLAALRLERNPVLREQGLREMEQAVLIYDCVARTGSEVLDTVLTEKSLICEREQISWTCLADGTALEFMPAVDVYTLFGNALDNAIESSRELEEVDKRIVSVTVQCARGMALIQVENYYAHEIQYRDGVPVSTKPEPEQHGYGLKSIAAIAQRYGGLMDISARDDIFLLTVMIPLPMETTE